MARTKVVPALARVGVISLLTALGGCFSNGDNDDPPAQAPAANRAPVFTSAAAVSVDEGNLATGYTATATDADGDALTYTVDGGADQAAFAIDGATGVLTFAAAPDFSAPSDADADNVYEVRLRVSDGTASATLDLAVTILSTNSAPVFTSSASQTVADGKTATGYTAKATDADGDMLTFGVAGGADAAAFTIDAASGALSFTAAPDAGAPNDADTNNVYEVRLEVSDGETTATLDVAITVVASGGLEIEVTFPTPNANLGGISTTIVTGNVVDPSGAAIDPADIDFIDVAGVNATLDAGNARRFSAQVPVVPGDNVLAIAFHRADGVVLSFDLALQNTQIHPGFNDIELDTSGVAANRALIVESFTDGLFGLDLATGARSVISDSTAGAGTNFSSPRDVAIDSNANRALVVDWQRDALVAVDLTTGDRTDISSPSVGMGVALDGPISVAYDAANDRALVVVSINNEVVAVDLSSGDRTLFSGVGTGTGPALDSPRDIEVDNVSAVVDRFAYLVDDNLEAIVALDLTSGDRTILSDAANGAGPTFKIPESLSLDVANNRIIVADLLGQVISVDVTTGNRTLIHDLAADFGVNGTNPLGVAVDGARALVADNRADAIFAIDLATGNRTVLSDNSVGSGPTKAGFWVLDGIALDRTGNQLIAPNREADALLGIDLASGDRTVISSAGAIVPAVGTGPAITTTQNPVVDEASNQAFIIPNPSSVYAVDLATGNRTIVSDNTSVGAGESFSVPVDIAVDVPNDRALVLDITKGILNVDLTNGDRTVVSSAAIGAGPALTQAIALGADFTADTAYTVDFIDDVLLSIDFTNGDRTVVSDNAGMGAGAAFNIPDDMELDLDNDRAFVIDRGFGLGLFEVSLTTGDRTIVSGTGVGIGVSFLSPYHVTVDVAGNRAFVYDVAVTGILVVELATGQRALMAR